MRSPVKRIVNRFLRLSVALGLNVTVAACGASDAGPGDVASASAALASGPAADYPMVIGDPYVIDGVEYVPADTLNYDEVGKLLPTVSRENGIFGAHRVLPLPSYVEVTSLDTGRTILVRLTARGPMAGEGVVGLSSEAMAQLRTTSETPVRVRRVNPPEAERALLRAGKRAPVRMDTPMSLVGVLRRRLPDTGSASLISSTPVETGSQTQVGDQNAKVAVEPVPAPTDNEIGETAVVVPVPDAEGLYVVQAGAFSTQERAETVASVIGGFVSPAGRFFRVRTGPFATRVEAQASLAKVHAAGYSEARIFISG